LSQRSHHSPRLAGISPLIKIGIDARKGIAPDR
jgi:hypothetical protein